LTKGLVSRLSEFMSDATDGRHGFRRVREFAQSAWQAEEDMYIDWVGYFSEREKQELYTPDFSASVGGRNSGDFLREFFRNGAKLDPMSRLGYVDSASFLCCNCLEYADRMSMANSLEVRAPFTDYRLLEFAMQVPQRLKVRNMTTKWITRQAMRGILPGEVLTKKKMGFNPPLPQWINGELKPVMKEFLSPASIERRGLFRPDAVQKLLRDHAENRRDNALKIWALLMIEVWQRMYFDKQSPESVLHSAKAGTKTMIQVGDVQSSKADVVCTP
jgi:asparagine synthase (glutamine-hydrolysing)